MAKKATILQQLQHAPTIVWCAVSLIYIDVRTLAAVFASGWLAAGVHAATSSSPPRRPCRPKFLFHFARLRRVLRWRMRRASGASGQLRRNRVQNAPASRSLMQNCGVAEQRCAICSSCRFATRSCDALARRNFSTPGALRSPAPPARRHHLQVQVRMASEPRGLAQEGLGEALHAPEMSARACFSS